MDHDNKLKRTLLMRAWYLIHSFNAKISGEEEEGKGNAGNDSNYLIKRFENLVISKKFLSPKKNTKKKPRPSMMVGATARTQCF